MSTVDTTNLREQQPVPVSVVPGFVAAHHFVERAVTVVLVVRVKAPPYPTVHYLDLVRAFYVSACRKNVFAVHNIESFL